ncbi:SpoVK/Ycf46/Vps4 family AAA+-type ATPase [Leifsonia sp. EB41]|uniref:ATP-binding protein n=1 Tax=Leifsonia sp. EB41 TaxID=3156260 RepID=UPI0035149E63
MDDALLDSLRRAVDAAPDDVALRLHLARLLLERGLGEEAVSVMGSVLQSDPANQEARELMAWSLSGRPPVPAAETAPAPEAAPPGRPDEFDWKAAEQEVDGVALPAFVRGDEPDGEPAFDAESPSVTLRDVGGMQSVKDRLQASFLAPLGNPELRKLYAKSLRGGLLMYGPPGCGKTFIARAVAGEIGARFISIGLTDILDPYMGNSEHNVHEAFQLARREAPCVLFFDEIDALGQRRSQTRNSAIRGTVNQLLTELDGVDGTNEGVFVLAATNQPWDVDPAMRRPGRLDRTVLVLPPDHDARMAIFRTHLASRPVEGIDLEKLAKRTELFSGADIAYVCELAAERALLDSVRSGVPRLIAMADLLAALDQVKPSTTSWLDSARNVVAFGNDDGTYSELGAYLRRMRRL